MTPTRVRFRVSSAIRSGTRISLSNSFTNRLRSLPLSLTTEESAAEYITSVPFGAMTGARPAEKLRNRRSNGLRLEASIRAILTPAPRLLISPSTVSRLKPSRRTSGFGPDLGVDRDHVALAAGLDAEPAEENQRDRAGLDLSVRLVEGAAHRVAGQVFADLDIEAVALEFVGDVAGVVDRLLQRRFGVGIFGVADHQRKPLAGRGAGAIGSTEKTEISNNARRIFIITQSSQKGADTSLRLGDLTLRKPHYQTGPAARQPFAKSIVNCDN